MDQITTLPDYSLTIVVHYAKLGAGVTANQGYIESHHRSTGPREMKYKYGWRPEMVNYYLRNWYESTSLVLGDRLRANRFRTVIYISEAVEDNTKCCLIRSLLLALRCAHKSFPASPHTP